MGITLVARKNMPWCEVFGSAKSLPKQCKISSKYQQLARWRVKIEGSKRIENSIALDAVIKEAVDLVCAYLAAHAIFKFNSKGIEFLLSKLNPILNALASFYNDD